MRRPVAMSSAAFLFLLAPVASPAHETWLLPERFAPPDGLELRLHLGSGAAFPNVESPVHREQIERAWGRLAGRERELWAGRVSEGTLDLRMDLPVPGIAALAVDLHGQPIDRTDAEVEEYLDAIAAPASVRATWEARPPGTRWHEISTEHAKTLVSAGRVGRDRSWNAPLGIALELVPDRDPFRLAPGDSVEFQLLWAGMPLASWPVTLIAAADSARTVRTTDGDGRALFVVPCSGALLAGAVHLRPGAEPGAWMSDYTTLTLVSRTFGIAVTDLELGTAVRWETAEWGAWQQAVYLSAARDQLLLTRGLESPVDSVPVARLLHLEARLPQPVHASRVLGYGLGGAVAGAVLTFTIIVGFSGDDWGALAAIPGLHVGAVVGFFVGCGVGALPPKAWEPVDRSSLTRPP